ncbi:phage regulatory CII family protein [Sphingorhabdus sp. 109]|uniref:phage regulatory CII family protein n=1 Tax=Sphingorhabdus sp. 109 TaxID=2653173 RepID=UPI0012F45C3E|nr:phage regulatory CII family protein [Sphingorhabdus sp. 109]VWX56694.1 hypothetical protein SPHINGOR109_10548 [Sphingorhabdus sp. 109]
MSRTTQLSPRMQLLKSASRALVRAFGGQVAAGEQLGKRHQRYSDVCLPNTEDFLTIAEVMDLESNTVGMADHPPVTRALAREQGYVLVPAADDTPDGHDWLTHVARLSSEAGEITSDIAASVADGDGVTASEVDQHKLEERAARLMDIAAAIHRTAQLTRGD